MSDKQPHRKGAGGWVGAALLNPWKRSHYRHVCRGEGGGGTQGAGAQREDSAVSANDASQFSHYQCISAVDINVRRLGDEGAFELPEHVALRVMTADDGGIATSTN